MYYMYSYTSLSTIVLNSRDWKESYGFRKNCTLKIKLYWLECIGIQGCNDAVPWLNEATS